MTDLSLRELHIKLSSAVKALEDCGVNPDAILSAKKIYVDELHPYSLTLSNSSQHRGSWVSNVPIDISAPSTGRRQIRRSTEDQLYEAIYEYYQCQFNASVSLIQVHDEYFNYLRTERNIAEKTIQTYQSSYNRFIKGLFDDSVSVAEIETAMINELIVSRCSQANEQAQKNSDEKCMMTYTALTKFISLLTNIFDFAIRQQYCSTNPTIGIRAMDYRKWCRTGRKHAEEKEFSDDEVTRILSQLDTTNPRDNAIRLAAATGMRVGELLAIHVDDLLTCDNIPVDPDHIKDAAKIHIHRQLVYSGSDYVEVPYTKNEKDFKADGRYFPVSDEVRVALILIQSSIGSSKYLLHDLDSDAPLKKDGYMHRLRKHCQKAKTEATNNHAFRMRLNHLLESKGFTSLERAMLLGHKMETNERFYSLVDSRRYKEISAKFCDSFATITASAA